jgi:outer membrane protein assembly factor BamB
MQFFRVMISLRFPVFAAAFGFSLLLNLDTRAQEWTRFRGPNGSGIAKAPNFPAQFSAADFNWNIELPGSGHSSPVIWGDRIFVTATPSGTARRAIVCVNAADGKTVWTKEYETAAFRQHADNSYTSMSPAVDAERVYVWWGAPEGSTLVALDQKDGREVWKCDLGPFVSQHGPGASPIVVGDAVLLSVDQDQPSSFLLAVEAATGKERWKFSHAGKNSAASTPCIFQNPDGKTEAILTSQTVGMTAVDVATGRQTWEIPGLFPVRCVASPIITEAGLVIGQCGEGQAQSFVYAVKPGSNGKPPEKLYEIVRTGGYVPSPIAIGGLLFLWKENGFVTCVRAAKNDQLWSERVDGPFYGSPIALNGRLYAITRRGDLVVIGAGEKFENIARIPLGEGSFATPAVSGGRMYLRTFTRLISVGK